MMIAMLVTAVLPAMAEKNFYELRVGEFHTLQVLDNVNVEWRCCRDSLGFVRFYGEERFADAFILTNNGKGTLKVQVSTDDVNHPDLPTLYIYSSFLTEVKSTSGLKVVARDMPASAKIKFILVGNGTIDAAGVESTRVEASVATGNGVISIQGQCGTASFTMVGTGQIRADELRSDDVNCTIMGTGAIFTWPLHTLKAKGIGSTKIYYRGEPAEMTKRGGGKFIPLSEAGSAHENNVAVEPDAVDETVGEEPWEEIPDEGGEEEEEEPLNVPRRRN